MSQAPNYLLNPDLEQADEQYKRRMDMARQLKEQAARPLQGQMVGNIYVKPHFLQGLANMFNDYNAGQIENQASNELKNARLQQKQNNAKELGDFMATYNGAPEKTQQNVVPDEYGTMTNQPIVTPAQEPDKAKAMAMALGSQNPLLQSLGGELAKQAFTPKQEKWEKTEMHQPDGSIIPGWVNVNSPNPEKTFRRLEGNVAPVKGVVNNGQIVSPYAIGTVTPKQPDAPNLGTNLVIPDANGNMIPNQPLIDARKAIAEKGATKVTNLVQTGQKAFEGELGKLDAKQLDEWRNAAQTSQNTLNVVKNLRDSDKAGAYSGGGANAKMAVGNMIEGFTGITPKGLVGSQLYNAEASKLVLDHVKALGANPSNADRDFIQKTVPQLNTSSEARKKMADWIEQKALQSINNYEQADLYARKNSGLGGYRQFKPIAPIAPQTAEKTIVRTGTSNGRKVVQYSDGSVEYAN